MLGQTNIPVSKLAVSGSKSATSSFLPLKAPQFLPTFSKATCLPGFFPAMASNTSSGVLPPEILQPVLEALGSSLASAIPCCRTMASAAEQGPFDILILWWAGSCEEGMRKDKGEDGMGACTTNSNQVFIIFRSADRLCHWVENRVPSPIFRDLSSLVDQWIDVS